MRRCGHGDDQDEEGAQSAAEHSLTKRRIWTPFNTKTYQQKTSECGENPVKEIHPRPSPQRLFYHKTMNVNFTKSRKNDPLIASEERMAELNEVMSLDADVAREYIDHLVDELTLEAAEAYRDLIRELRGKAKGSNVATPVELKKQTEIANTMMKVGLSMDAISRLRMAMQRSSPVQPGIATGPPIIEMPASLPDKEWEQIYEKKFLDKTNLDPKKLT